MKLTNGPREKLEKLGIKSLTNEELIAILIKTGTKNETVLDLSKRILSDIDTLNLLNDYSYEELMSYKGLGKAKAMTIVCAIELGNRIRYEKYNRNQIKSVKDEVDYIKNDFIDNSYEKIIVVYLSHNNYIISKQIFESESKIMIRLDINAIIKKSLRLNAFSVVIAHNHPDNVCLPSKEDVLTINNLKNKLNELEIELFDSLIFTDNEYYSMIYSVEPRRLK